jgi:hypothetical protein
MDLEQLSKDIDSNIKLINAVTLDRLKTLNDHNLYVNTHKETIELQRQKIELLESQLDRVSWRTIIKDITWQHIALLVLIIVALLLALGVEVNSIASIVKAFKGI